MITFSNVSKPENPSITSISNGLRVKCLFTRRCAFLINTSIINYTPSDSYSFKIVSESGGFKNREQHIDHDDVTYELINSTT
jgi:hypothetical protein